MKPNWYKEKRSKKSRKIIYNFLRVMGFDVETAIRVRDWSNEHIRSFVCNNTFCKLKNEKKKISDKL